MKDPILVLTFLLPVSVEFEMFLWPFKCILENGQFHHCNISQNCPQSRCKPAVGGTQLRSPLPCEEKTDTLGFLLFIDNGLHLNASEAITIPKIAAPPNMAGAPP